MVLRSVRLWGNRWSAGWVATRLLDPTAIDSLVAGRGSSSLIHPPFGRDTDAAFCLTLLIADTGPAQALTAAARERGALCTASIGRTEPTRLSVLLGPWPAGLPETTETNRPMS